MRSKEIFQESADVFTETIFPSVSSARDYMFCAEKTERRKYY